MALLLVDGLEPAEAAALRAHLAEGCTRCAAHLAEADATLNFLPYALDPTTPSAEARERLFARVGQVEPMQIASYASSRPGRRVGTSWMPRWVRASLPAAVAACIAFVTAVQVMRITQRDRDTVFRKQLADDRQALAVRETRINDLTRQVQTSDQIIQIAYTSNKQIMLEGRGSQTRAFGRAVWNEQRQAWHFRAFGLEQVSPKEAYELWFVTPYGRKVPAATFRPDEQGNAILVASLPKDVGPVSGAFVTDEPSVGTFQPTGTTHLTGKLE